jgi:hypothetical protein
MLTLRVYHPVKVVEFFRIVEEEGEKGTRRGKGDRKGQEKGTGIFNESEQKDAFPLWLQGKATIIGRRYNCGRTRAGPRHALRAGYHESATVVSGGEL